MGQSNEGSPALEQRGEYRICKILILGNTENLTGQFSEQLLKVGSNPTFTQD